MFSTFSAAQPPSPSPYEVESPRPTKSRPKRHQVARACVWCRTYRVKCDAGYPCRNCVAKGRKCSTDKGKDEVRTFPSAIKEIDRLKERVKELEEQLGSLSTDVPGRDQEEVAQPASVLTLPVELDPWAQHGANRKFFNWDSVSTTTAQGQQTYGPSSAVYFISHISSHPEVPLQYPIMHLHTPSIRFPFEGSTGDGINALSSIQIAVPAKEEDLSRPQEESILALYWKTYHSVFPVIEQEEFNDYYSALWDASRALRKPSAMVDIMLAICMQHQASFLADDTPRDATIAGAWWHRRGQNTLSDQLEEPSMCTFRTCLLSVVWLQNAGLLNMAHSVMAMGIRTGIILGLHLEPPKYLPEGERELRKRLWWSLYTLDMKYSMDLGRPLAVHFSQVTCSLPRERWVASNGGDRRISRVNESCSPHEASEGNDAVDGVKKWTERDILFHVQVVKLFLAVRAIYITFYGKCGEVLRKSGQESLYHDADGLEECAKYLSSKMIYLQKWVQQVPDGLKCKRQNRGQPFSTDRSPLDVSSPRQGILLELVYHKLTMTLHRPLISLSTASSRGKEVSESHAISCINHAIAMTTIIHQLLTLPDHIHNWVGLSQWQCQWHATLSLIGYLLAYPAGPVAYVARQALDKTVAIFDILSRCLPGAATAATVTRDLVSRIDRHIARAERLLLLGTVSVASGEPELSVPEIEAGGCGFDDQPCAGAVPPLGEGDLGTFEGSLANLQEFAFTSNAFADLEGMGADGETMFDFLDFGSMERF